MSLPCKFQSESKDLKTRKANGVSRGPRAGETNVLLGSQAVRQRENMSLSSFLLSSGPQLIG